MEAGEITANIRIEKSGNNYILTLNGSRVDPQKRTRVTLIDNKKKRVTLNEYASFTVADFKRKLIAGPFCHTNPGGTFHDTMTKKAVSENDKLEAIGIKGHDTFTKEYDISFFYDPALVTGAPSTVSPTPAPASAPGGGSSSGTGTGSSGNAGRIQFTMTLSVNVEGDSHVIKATGESALYFPVQEITIKNKEFSETRVSDFLEKLNDTWPKFERGGIIVNPSGKGTDNFTNRTKLEAMGIEGTSGTKKNFTLIFEIDPSAPAPTPTSAPRKAKISEPPHVQETAAPPSKIMKNISISSEPTTSEPVSRAVVHEKEEELNLEIEIIPVSYRVTVRGRPTTGPSQNGRCDITEADFGMSVDELLKKAGISWPEGKREGQFLSEPKKHINSGDTIQRIGIKSTPSHTYHCNFKLPRAKSTTSTLTSASGGPRHVPRAAKPHKTGTFEQLKMELRIFVDGGMCLINIRGQSRDFKGDMELSIKSTDYERMTVDDLLSKLGRRWPPLEPEGWHQTTNGPTTFVGSDRLTSAGFVTDASHTVAYQLIFPIGEDRPSNADLTAAKAAVAERIAQRQQQQSAPQAVGRGGISEGSLGVNVRIFYDSGNYNLQLNGAGGDFRAENDFIFRNEEYLALTFGELKRKLRRWPETASVGKFHSQSGNVSFSDQDKLFDIGIIASNDGYPAMHQFSWELI